MEVGGAPNSWRAKVEGDSWRISDAEGNRIATLERSSNQEAHARLIAASPYMLDALRGLLELIGDEDLPDNGELSGAAICDMARTAVTLAVGTSHLHR